MERLIIKDLNFSYGKELILKNISLEINEGIVALLGPNGAGKTTLMKILATLLESKENNISLNEINYKKLKKIRGLIGYLPQKFETYKQVTGREFLNFIYDVKGLNINKKEHIDEIIKMVDLEEFIDKKIKTYSGGVLRRLGIGQALIGNPKLVIVDEPTVGLDPEQRNHFRNLLATISSKRIILISTHLVDDIDFCANEIFIINKGEIKYKGESKKLINQCKNYIWKTILDKEEFEKLKESYEILNFRIYNNQYEVKYISEKPADLKSENFDISLEDAYLYLINGGL